MGYIQISWHYRWKRSSFALLLIYSGDRSSWGSDDIPGVSQTYGEINDSNYSLKEPSPERGWRRPRWVISWLDRYFSQTDTNYKYLWNDSYLADILRVIFRVILLLINSPYAKKHFESHLLFEITIVAVIIDQQCARLATSFARRFSRQVPWEWGCSPYQRVPWGLFLERITFLEWKTFRAWEARCQTAICLFWKANLFHVCNARKTKESLMV